MSEPCEACGGTGWETVQQDGRHFARRCACRRSSAPGGEGVLAGTRLPPRYEHCELGSFEPGNTSLRAALEKCLAYCANYPFLRPEDEGLGLLFTGDTGVGKTHLAVAVMRELLTTRGVRGQYWDFNDLIREIKDSYNPETKTTELGVLEPVIGADLLVLDDLGAWKMTDWMNDTLFYLLNNRYMAKRATIITTNFQDADREAVLAADPMRRREFLVERIGQRLRSRLMEMCVVIPLSGPDHRRQRQEGNQVSLRTLGGGGRS